MKKKTLEEQKVSDQKPYKIRKILRADAQKLKSAITFDISN